jgi:hypothetical protein
MRASAIRDMKNMWCLWCRYICIPCHVSCRAVCLIYHNPQSLLLFSQHMPHGIRQAVNDGNIMKLISIKQSRCFWVCFYNYHTTSVTVRLSAQVQSFLMFWLPDRMYREATTKDCDLDRGSASLEPAIVSSSIFLEASLDHPGGSGNRTAQCPVLAKNHSLQL